MENEPITKVKWIDRETLKPNDYNPNRVNSPELELLKISILEDGWTQPIVINVKNEIVDGFHRWKVSGSKELLKKYKGMVPVVVVESQDDSHQRMSTIRHNRARGVHGVLDMAKIVRSFVDSGMSQQEIELRLQMEPEEVVRLCLREGLSKSKIVQDNEFSKAWEV